MKTLREMIDSDYFGLDLDVPRPAWKVAGLDRRDVDRIGDLTLDEAEQMVSATVTTTAGERFQANLLGTILAAYDAAGRAGEAAFQCRWELFLKQSKPLPTADPDGVFGFSVAKPTKPSKFTLKVGGKKITQ